MPLNAETEALLKDLEKSGFDMSSVRQQATGNPILENAANSKIGGGILRRKEFETFKTAAETQVTSLQNQLKELASLNSSKGSLEGNPDLHRAALERIEILESNLIKEGYDPQELKDLTFETKSGLARMLTEAPDKAATSSGGGGGQRGGEMADDKDFVTSDILLTSLANNALGGVLGSAQVAFQLRRAEKLGVEITPDMMNKFGENLFNGLQSKKSYEEIANETFGLPEIENKKREEEEIKRIDARARELAAEHLKDAGLPSVRLTSGRQNKSVMDGYRETLAAKSQVEIQGEGGTKVVGGIKLPVNKYDDIEFHKLRGTKADRMAHAVAALREREETHPEEFEEVY